MKRFVFLLSMFCVALAMVSCKGEGKSMLTPASSGRPYEVLVVADDNCCIMFSIPMFLVCRSLNARSVFQECAQHFMISRCACSAI